MYPQFISRAKTEKNLTHTPIKSLNADVLEIKQVRFVFNDKVLFKSHVANIHYNHQGHCNEYPQHIFFLQKYKTLSFSYLPTLPYFSVICLIRGSERANVKQIFVYLLQQLL